MTAADLREADDAAMERVTLLIAQSHYNLGSANAKPPFQLANNWPFGQQLGKFCWPTIAGELCPFFLLLANNCWSSVGRRCEARAPLHKGRAGP